ncbi:hypothetical protein ACIQCJ_29230 [Streptomyces sp. NPDC093221]|uniref:hypothetical protein n=1 Tax=Streptomyces sp. NPDC093221 TaxID=3366032 RepID=UPI003812922C
MDSAKRPDDIYRADFAQVLDQALRGERVRLALRALPGAPNTEQLRTAALADADAIGATAAAEYERYTGLRAHSRGRVRPVVRAVGGPGVLATLAVLVPMLSGIAAAIFLVLGYGIRAVASGAGISAPLIDIGFLCAAVFGVSLLIGLAGLALTARRDGAVTRESRDVTEAHEAWRQALLVRGVLPYLLDRLAREAGAAAPRAVGPPPVGVDLVRQRPRLGYSSPGFSSGDGVSLVRQRPRLGYSSPGFSSPNDGER